MISIRRFSNGSSQKVGILLVWALLILYTCPAADSVSSGERGELLVDEAVKLLHELKP